MRAIRLVPGCKFRDHTMLLMMILRTTVMRLTLELRDLGHDVDVTRSFASRTFHGAPRATEVEIVIRAGGDALYTPTCSGSPDGLGCELPRREAAKGCSQNPK